DPVSDRLSRIVLDEVGPWSVRKAEMVAYYAQVYASIIARFDSYYIDGFANRGLSRLKSTDEVVPGSALRVLSVHPSFHRYIFVEVNHARFEDLRDIVYAQFGTRQDVSLVHGDANVEIPHLLANIQYTNFQRALTFLDPYNMHGLKWPTILAAGQNEAVDAIIHFPTMDANRTVLKRRHGTASAAMYRKMTEYWGDDSWEGAAYSSEGLLPLGLAPVRESAKAIISAFRERLRSVAGFKVVSNPIPMRNTTGGVVYHLLVASHNKKATDVIRPIEKRFIN
ncbi:MAG TPA: three-Cys-motif partner protein TcmP, partial [Candidatus Elarobacter sp.]|nr:three-Cys-motif partner protein TcmP [Candidatus Elarobacter sp.]